MRITTTIKELVESLPESMARPLAGIPFSLRLGREYTRSVRRIKSTELKDPKSLEEKQCAQLKSILESAVRNVEFYRNFYRAKGYDPKQLRTLKDWEEVPIVTKADLQSAPLEHRTARGRNGIKTNTGGTSGQPLAFYLERNAFAREWAHMHHIWRARGYSPSHVKLTFRGKHFSADEVLRYNAVHNEYIVNASSTMEQVLDHVLRLRPSIVIRWIHGYPSLIAEFAQAIRNDARVESSRFRRRLYGALLGSEYPAPIYRDAIEQELSSNIVSWYGHSEMCVLARESSQGTYESFSTYGYAEAVPIMDSENSRLISTCFHNDVHPFIRYDTGDLITAVSSNSGSLAFKISDGRIGDFVRDRKGRRHSLTAIIFGRHHSAFEKIRHIQVRENFPGSLTLLVCPIDSSLNPSTLRAHFNFGDLDLEWTIEAASEPVRSNAGKIRLKIT